MITTCDQCGKMIIVTKTERKRHKHHFCDRDCYHNYRVLHCWTYTPKTNPIQDKLSVWAEIRRKRRYDMDLKDKDIKQLGMLLACTKGKKYKEILKEYMKRKESKK